MRTYIYLLCIACCCYGCTEEIDGNDVGSKVLRGRLFLQTDPENVANPLPLAAAAVTVNYTEASDTFNYLFRDTTDHDGYFEFPLLREAGTYTVRYKENHDSILYFGKATAQVPQETLFLQATMATTGQTGLQLLAVDSTTGQPLAGVRHCLYRSASVAAEAGNSCVNSNYTLISGATGYSQKAGLMPGSYTVISNFLQADRPLSTTNELQIYHDRVLFQTIALRPSINLKFITQDSLGAQLPGASICVFSSELLYQREDCGRSNYRLTTDNNGLGSVAAPPAGKYFIYSEYRQDSLIWTARDTMHFTPQQEYQIVLNLR